LISASGPSTTPNTIGVSGKPFLTMINPRTPKISKVQMSEVELLRVNTPIAQYNRITTPRI